MYVPSHFAASDDQVDALLRSVTAADLVTPTGSGLIATFLPLMYDAPAGALLGHVARNNSHWQAAGDDGESLVIVHGPDDYISPSWYPSKHEHGRAVPTWNYTTAHVYGRLVAHDDVDWLRAFVTRLTERHENDRATPWQVTDAPERFIAGQLRAIVGLELQITRVEAKVKLSQNRSAADQAGVVTGLRETATPAAVELAAEMTATTRPAVDDQGTRPAIAGQVP
ncbi:MAG: FMN-binding negative transcriptional regulator [Jatrophihabitans sp.]